MITIDWQGIPEMQRALQQLQQRAMPALLQAIAAEAERILAASIPLVPVDTGLLVSTGMVEQQSDGSTIRYGGHGLAPYALVQHEGVTFQHPNGGQAKFLQQPLFEATAGMAERLAQDVGQGLRG